MTERTPLELLAVGVASFERYLHHDGTLHDPIFETPTQYGSSYYGWCCAVLSKHAAELQPGGLDADDYRARADQLMTTALGHTADPTMAPHASAFNKQTLGIASRFNHRDFTWPPIMKTFLALGDTMAGHDDIAQKIAAVDIGTSFRSLPPSNWAAVWMSGEWLRMREGLSPTSVEQFDEWLDGFFDSTSMTGFDLNLGMYTEPGLPNAYDLFTRVHLTDLVNCGYDGRNRDRLSAFLGAGLRRSLVMQLSDGSMASGYRSAAQTWVLAAQIALFTGSRVAGIGSASERDAAATAAWRAYSSLESWQRTDGPFSPVQNALDPRLRVGYETYTADGHYSSLALAFLASAIELGFPHGKRPTAAQLDDRGFHAHIEDAPTHRGIIHSGRVSAALQTQTDGVYDATGIVDITFGSGRLLQFVSSARHISGGAWLNPGLALRLLPGADEVVTVAGCRHELVSSLTKSGDGGLSFGTSITSAQIDTTETVADGQSYECEIVPTNDGFIVTESTPARIGYRTLLIPYPRDFGTGGHTTVELLDTGVRFSFGAEVVEFHVEGALERRTDLPAGYENRRALCGLVRLDLLEKGDFLRWWVVSSPSSLEGESEDVGSTRAGDEPQPQANYGMSA